MGVAAPPQIAVSLNLPADIVVETQQAFIVQGGRALEIADARVRGAHALRGEQGRMAGQPPGSGKPRNTTMMVSGILRAIIFDVIAAGLLAWMET